MSARVFLIRHGETDWSLGNKHCSFTDIPLSKQGESQTTYTKDWDVGEGRLIDPKNITRMYDPIYYHTSIGLMLESWVVRLVN